MVFRGALAALAAALLLSGCLPTAPGIAPLAATETAPAESPTTPVRQLPALSFTDVTIVPGTGADGVQVVGLARNDSSLPLLDVSLAIELLDDAGVRLGSITTPLLLTTLQPGATSPFLAGLPLAVAPVSARVTLDGFRFAARVPMDVALDSVSMAPAPKGSQFLGLIRNQGLQPVQIGELAVTWRDASGSLSGAGLAALPDIPVPPDGTLPWTALTPGVVEAGAIEVYAAATGARPGPEGRLEASVAPGWYQTDQGHGFATGEIRNVSGVPLMPTVSVALWAQGQLVGLQILRSSVPLPPGESLAFGAETFPALDVRLRRMGAGVEDVVPTVILGGSIAPLTAAPPLLAITVRQFEVIGSRVFLEGTLVRGDDQPLAGAEIHVALRTVDGELQSAAWMPIAPGNPGAPVPFRLDLPVPVGADAALSEIDLRALGMPFSP